MGDGYSIPFLPMSKQGLSGYHVADHIRKEKKNKLSEAINT
jgi:hypothetical protein